MDNNLNQNPNVPTSTPLTNSVPVSDSATSQTTTPKPTPTLETNAPAPVAAEVETLVTPTPGLENTSNAVNQNTSIDTLSLNQAPITENVTQPILNNNDVIVGTTNAQQAQATLEASSSLDNKNKKDYSKTIKIILIVVGTLLAMIAAFFIGVKVASLF